MTRDTDPSTLPVLDDAMIGQLRDLSSDGEDLLREVVETFLGDSPQHLVAMNRALSAGDGEALHRAAHTLRGSCSNLGLVRLQKVCAEVDRRARAGDLAGVSDLLIQVEAAYVEGEAALRALF